jgi:hypothetical protein
VIIVTPASNRRGSSCCRSIEDIPVHTYGATGNMQTLK